MVQGTLRAEREVLERIETDLRAELEPKGRVVCLRRPSPDEIVHPLVFHHEGMARVGQRLNPVRSDGRTAARAKLIGQRYHEQQEVRGQCARCECVDGM
jgi:hypothetical protein